jgi:chaperonin GroES
MSLRPLSDNVLVRQIETENKTQSGIVLATESKPATQAVVIEVGPGKWDNGVFIKTLLNPGNVVELGYLNSSIHKPVNVNGKQYLIVKESDILAIVE